jgi:hypothetical protein
MSADPRRAVVDLPAAPDLAGRVARFLFDEVMPAVEDQKLRHRVRVAVNLLHLVEREIALEDVAVDQDGRIATPELLRRFGSVAAAARQLEDGEISIVDPEVMGLLRDHTLMKVRVAETRGRRSQDGAQQA